MNYDCLAEYCLPLISVKGEGQTFLPELHPLCEPISYQASAETKTCPCRLPPRWVRMAADHLVPSARRSIPRPTPGADAASELPTRDRTGSPTFAKVAKEANH